MVLSDSTAMKISPRINNALIRENAAPISLLIQSSMTSLRIFSRIRAIRPRIRNTPMRMIANDTTLRTCSEAVRYSESHAPTRLANLAEAHTPAMIDMMDIACDMNPFLKPCINAGMRQIKIMISNIFINTLKCVYLRIEIFGS